MRGWPGTAVSLWVFSWMWQPQSTLLAIAFVVFPDGHIQHRWHRWTVWLLAGLCGASMLVSIVRPGVIVATPDHLDGTFPGVDNPIGIQALGPIAEPVANMLLAFSFVVFLLPIVVTAIGWVRSADIRRRQYRWATLLQIAGIVATVVVVGLPGNVGSALILVQTLATQVLIVVAILRWRAFDVDVVIRRSVLAGTLLVVGLGVYGVVVAIVSSTVGRDGRVASLVGAGAVVLTVAPAALIAAHRRRPGLLRSTWRPVRRGRRTGPEGVGRERSRRSARRDRRGDHAGAEAAVRGDPR